jgi:diguanylate cyclase (GGDEF)-like protein/PAS domain S-box-containing protein
MSKTSFMPGKLCILSCYGFHREIAAAVAAEGWDDVTVAAFPARCGRPPVSWEELSPLLSEDCTQAVVLGRACLGELGEPPAWPPIRLLHQELCFHLVAGATLVADAIERGAYLMTPAWLEDWPRRLAEMGFTQENAGDFFQDFAQELVLLDTGIIPQIPAYLSSLAEATGLPATRIAVGIDHTRLLLTKIVMEWRQEQERHKALVHDEQRDRELANHAMTIDCLSRLTQIMTEPEVIASIEDLFRMLFAPEKLYYLRIENGAFEPKHNIPGDILKQMQELSADYAWLPACNGFLLRIARGGQAMGVIAAGQLAFPEFRENYLNLALSIGGVCGLSIENARTYQRIKAVDDTLHESEQRLALAALYNGVGIWDWNLETQVMIWDDSMYALYHINREDFSGTEEAWRAALHPDDLERGDREVEEALSGRKPFDTEFRVRWPNGDIRYIKAVAKVFRDDQGKPLRMLGTNMDITELKQAENSLRLLSEVTENAAEGIALIKASDGTIHYANQRFELLYGYAPGELTGKHISIINATTDRTPQETAAEIIGLVEKNGFWTGEVLNRKKDGTRLWAFANVSTFEHSELGTLLITYQSDITARKQIEAQLQLSASVFTHAREGIIITDAQGTIVEVNAAFSRIAGYSREEALGQNPRMLQSGRHSPEFYEDLWQTLTETGHWDGEIWNRRKNGGVYAEMITISAVRNNAGQTQNYVALFTDITPMKEYQQQLEHIAHYDVLTGLPNRVLLADRLQQAMVQSQRRSQSLAVAFIDLDGFKAVNDNYGHDIGDQLLITIAQRMKAALRSADTLSRIGGDEFVALLVDLDQPPVGYEPVIARLLQAAANPVPVGDAVLYVSASIGVTLYPQDDANADQLMRHADQAMYQAKQTGKNRYHLFDAIRGV